MLLLLYFKSRSDWQNCPLEVFTNLEFDWRIIELTMRKQWMIGRFYLFHKKKLFEYDIYSSSVLHIFFWQFWKNYLLEFENHFDTLANKKGFRQFNRLLSPNIVSWNSSLKRLISQSPVKKPLDISVVYAFKRLPANGLVHICHLGTYVNHSRGVRHLCRTW